MLIVVAVGELARSRTAESTRPRLRAHELQPLDVPELVARRPGSRRRTSGIDAGMIRRQRSPCPWSTACARPASPPRRSPASPAKIPAQYLGGHWYSRCSTRTALLFQYKRRQPAKGFTDWILFRRAPPFDALRWDNSFARLPGRILPAVTPTAARRTRLVAFNPDAAAAARPRSRVGRRRSRIRGGDQRRMAVPGTRSARGNLRRPPVRRLGAAAWRRPRHPARRSRRPPPRSAGTCSSRAPALTRFSRMGDGRAVLRSTHSRIPRAAKRCTASAFRRRARWRSSAATRRSTASRSETGAVLVRLAPTHVRFGSFELLRRRAASTPKCSSSPTT